jgi:flagellin-like protein
MKGVSTVIATLLMLVITISLAGLTYAYMSGLFSTQTSVVLQVDAGATSCSGTTISMFVKNVGTGSGSVTAYAATTIGGTPVQCTGGTNPQTIAAGGSATFTCTKTGASGYYALRATASGTSASGNVYCSS